MVSTPRIPASVNVWDFMTYDEIVADIRENNTYAARDTNSTFPEANAANYLMLVGRRHHLPPDHPGYEERVGG